MSERGSQWEDLLADIDIDLEKPKDIPQLLSAYDQNGLGRAFEVILKNDAGKETPVLGAYVLPFDEDQRKHLIIMRTGDMLLMKPQDDNTATIFEYKRMFNPTSIPYRYIVNNETLENSLNHLKLALYPQFSAGHAVASITNFLGEDIDEFNKLARKAVHASQILQEKRTQGIEKSTKYLLSIGLEKRIFPEIPDNIGIHASQLNKTDDIQMIPDDTFSSLYY